VNRLKLTSQVIGLILLLQSSQLFSQESASQSENNFKIHSSGTLQSNRVPAQDSLALVALFNSTAGASWTTKTNWLSGQPVSTWFGVTVSSNRVTELILISNGLDGTLPSEIGDLTNLTYLDLENNNLSGAIPNEIGNLTDLVYLYLNKNQFSEAIPDTIGNLTKLEDLWLDRNQLIGAIPATIGDLTVLDRLFLHTNNLSEVIPPEIGDLTNLTELDLSFNTLTGTIPTEIGNLTNLTELDLSFNTLTGTIPTEIGNLTNLTRLIFENNGQLTGTIPATIGNLTGLTSFDISDNMISGSIPTEVGVLVNLTYFNVNDNNLTGSIPTVIGNLVNLTSLELNGNALTGTIPTEIGNLVLLDTLELDNNQLSGAVPASVTNLNVLGRLFLNDNQLDVLPGLSAIDSLALLRIQNNRFTFEDIEPNIGVPSTEFTYSPQDTVGTAQDTTKAPGSALTLSISIGGENNQYQWFKDSIAVPGAINSSFTIDPVDFTDAGMYHCQITNTLATALTLTSRSTNVTVANTPLQIDSLAVVALYNSTAGASWTDNTNWLSSQPLSTWSGVTVGGNRITNLVLEVNNLTGTLPAEIGDLTSLTLLDLSNNQLNAIPPEIGNLAMLTDLELDNNQLSGVIPTEIGNLAALTRLDVTRNNLTGGIPTSIGNLTELNDLSLSENQLNGAIPAEVGNLTKLTFLNLGGNQLSGEIPQEIYNLTSLSHFLLNTNQLTGSLAPEIGNLTSLVSLFLHDNQISGAIPSEIGNLTNLVTMAIEGNQFSGAIPSEIGSLVNLTGFHLDRNQLTGAIPPEIGNLTNLLTIRLSGNQLSGPMPTEIGNLTNLTSLNLTGNQLSGEIPTEIGDLTNLTTLFLGANLFSDVIPTTIGNLINLNEFNIQGNQLTGAIPPGITNLTNLTEFFLNGNQLIDLPGLSSIDSLQTLRIQNNQFTFDDIEPNIGVASTEFTYTPQDSVGTEQNTTVDPGSDLTISVTVGGDSNQYQWFKGVSQITGATDNFYTINSADALDTGSYICQITNTVATALTLLSRPINVFLTSPAVVDSLALVSLYNTTDGANWTDKTNWLSDQPLSTWAGVTVAANRVTGLAFENNNLTGTLPAAIGNLTSLIFLDLSNNQLTAIPPEIGNLTSLTTLDLAVNDLTGSIPPEIGNLVGLTDLFLDLNELTGTIPPEFGNLINLGGIFINGNQLSGTIPPEIGNLTKATGMNLGNNQLSGEMPPELFNLTALTFVGLGANQFTGSIPPEIGNLTALTNLELRGNQLTGTIPPEIGNLTSLTALVLGSNQLTGEIPPEIGNLTDLIDLQIGNNLLSGSIPPQIGNLIELRILSLDLNRLAGAIPAELGNLTNLTSLSLSGNQLSGDIPDEINNLSALTDLFLNDNQFTGALAPEIGNLTSLQELSLHSNQLSGSIPSEIGNLTGLTRFDLEGNEFTGSIPSEVGNLINLTGFHLDRNQLTGAIPPEIGNLTNLLTIRLFENQLSGPIPPEIGNLINLTFLDFRDNQLSGAVPAAMANFSQLDQLILNNNLLTGFPDLSPIDTLRILWIHDNQFTFEDIEPNIGGPSGEFIYAPQDSVGTAQDTTLAPGADLTVSVTVGGDNNQYRWLKDGLPIAGATESSYDINSVGLSESGSYVCQITNTVASALTLFSRPVVVSVTDQDSPQISHSAVSSGQSGQNLTISADLTDDVGIQSATLFYRHSGATQYSSTSMTNTGGDTWQASIPAGSVTQRGSEYYISATDGSGKITTFPATDPAQNPLAIQVASSNLTFSSPNSAYRMISVPIALDNASPLNVLQDDLGPYDDTEWRLLRYINGVNQEFTGANIGNFNPGSGFWLITDSAKNLGTGSGSSVTTSQNFTITLQPGWNQIGNPFAFSVSWNDVIKGANVENRLVGYGGSANDATGYDFNRTQLAPFQGYFVNNNSGGTSTIEIPPISATGNSEVAKESAGLPILNELQSAEWVLQITAQIDRFLDKDNYLGVLNEASDTWDTDDFSEAPFFDEFVSLYFPHEDWETHPGLYTGDFQTENSEGHLWDFKVKSNIANSEVVLNLAGIHNLSSEMAVVLIDKASRISQDLQEQSSYRFPTNEKGVERDFRIVVGHEDFISNNDLGFSGVPEAFSLSQNYPNPFNPETHMDYEIPLESEVNISVYNLRGQKVQVLFNGKQSAGRYSVSWNGRSESGLSVASGVYLVRIQANEFVSVKKMALTK